MFCQYIKIKVSQVAVHSPYIDVSQNTCSKELEFKDFQQSMLSTLLLASPLFSAPTYHLHIYITREALKTFEFGIPIVF